MSQRIIDMAQSAERIMLPVSKDAASGLRAFTGLTGIEVPESLTDKEIVRAAGREFRLARGADMPGQIAADWADLALCSTEFVREARLPRVQSARIGDPICRYSVLALESVAEDWREQLSRGSRYPLSVWNLPASFPNFLNLIAAAQDLPIRAMSVPISGKAEATMRASGIGAVADRVVTGRTAQRLGGQEVYVLAEIFPELVWRSQDADV